MRERPLVDAGPMVAIFSEDDANHRRCLDAMRVMDTPLPTCWPVVVEAAWLLRKRPISLQRLFDSFERGLFDLLPLEVADLAAIADIMRRYENIGLQLADAALVHLADREGIRAVFTLDRRDFSVVRLKRNRSLRLIPDPA